MENLTDNVIADLKMVVADTEALLNATINQGGDKVAEVRAKAEKSLKVAKATITEAQSVIVTRTKAAVRATDAYAHENPWKAIGTATGIALLIGLLMGRK